MFCVWGRFGIWWEEFVEEVEGGIYFCYDLRLVYISVVISIILFLEFVGFNLVFVFVGIFCWVDIRRIIL